ncbi:hypothetical protein BKA70DRAFT_1424543 [Coprinopsis sp. MPI-PUGE-AT-0042]|nr:hypothetical protein BKA70DRAFT_1445700 [Coprinopsis sp. MPI-PUGE-AT-0042]KAH6910047.1 hypothetical protein BKA70DRAFT_1424543 [Coprinopsis sp. MPI-PUGE-AT-0042]
MHNFKDIHPNVLKAFTKELDAPHIVHPTSSPELSAGVYYGGRHGCGDAADFEGWISRHYEVLIQLPRAIDASWRVFMCTLCACMMRLYAFPDLVRRLRQGLPTDPRPWADLWLTPTANFPVLVARSNLKTTRLPRSAVNPTGSLYERIWAVYLDIWAANPRTARAPSLISMDAVEEGVSITELMDLELANRPVSKSARTKPSKGKNREVIDLSSGTTSGSVPSTSKAPAPSVPPPTGNFEGVVVETPRNRKRARLETGNISDDGVEILDPPAPRTIVSRPRGGAPKTLTRAPKPPATPSSSKVMPTSSPSTAPSSPTSQLPRAPMPAAAAPRAAVPSASQPRPQQLDRRPSLLPSHMVESRTTTFVSSQANLGPNISVQRSRRLAVAAQSQAPGALFESEDLGPCIAPGPGQPCNHCTRDKQKCTFTLPTEDRNIVANNAYLAGTMSPAAIVEGAERVARHAQLFALMEQTAYAMAAEGLAEQRKFLSNLRRAEHMMGKEAVIAQLFGSEELYEEYQEHFAHAFDDERPLPNLPLVDVAWFAQELLDMEEEEVLEARVQEEVERRLAAMSVGGATVAPAPVAPASEPPSVSAPSVAAPASAGLGALAEYADSPESPPNSDQEMDTSK